MLALPDVSLVMIETREHALAKLALAQSEQQATFGDVLVFTDRPQMFRGNNRRIIAVPDWPEKIGWSKCFWYSVAEHVRTSHILGIQWDSWVVNPQSWRDEFLRYDFIGAPWWHKDGMNVGNGGFSLRSTRFARFIAKHRARFPCTSHLDDDLYCRSYRPTLEAEGFVWASQAIAEKFAFECLDAIGPTFGFHGAMNFWKVLDLEKLVERTKLMKESPGIYGGRIWGYFTKRASEYPQIIQELVNQSKELEQQQGAGHP